MTIRSEPFDILIVDGDTTSGAGLLRMLEQSDLPLSTIEHATDLVNAVDMLDKRSFDVVLLDLNLPHRAAAEAVSRIRKHAPGAAIVVITGEYDDNAELNAITKGAQEYVVKDRLSRESLGKSIRYAIERRKADREFKGTSERFKKIFENSAVAIMVADEKERITSWNKAASDLLMMSYDELYLKPVKELYAEGEWQRLRERGIREKGKERNYETIMMRRDGELIDVDLSISVVRDGKGAIVGSIGIVSDITERKRIHEILNHKQRNLEAIFDAVPVGMLLLDKNLIVKRVNAAIKNMFGKEYPDMINRPIGAAVGCVNHEPGQKDGEHNPLCSDCKLVRTLQNAVTSENSLGEVEVCLTVAHSQGKQTRWLGVSAEPAILGNRKHVVAAIVDISSRKEAEKRLKETIELKAQFVAMVSHELRSPLGCIKEAVGLVLDGVAGPINKKQKDLLEITKRNIERLGLLTNDVLDVHRLESGQVTLDLDDYNMCEVIQEVHTTMNCTASKKNIQLVIEKEGHSAKARFDKDKMVQVLTNLLGNAIKFTEGGGCITTRLRHKSDCLQIQVTDTGRGIPARDLPRIFDRFFQVHEIYRQTKGTGLGLYTSKLILQQHNSTISVNSNKHTTFTVIFPVTVS